MRVTPNRSGGCSRLPCSQHPQQQRRRGSRFLREAPSCKTLSKAVEVIGSSQEEGEGRDFSPEFVAERTFLPKSEAAPEEAAVRAQLEEGEGNSSRFHLAVFRFSFSLFILSVPG